MNRPAMPSIIKFHAGATRLLLATGLALAVAACGSGDSAQEQAQRPEPPLAGATIGGDFTLTNSEGEPVSWTDFNGQWRIVYFGYTYCPDICPVDAAGIGGGLTRFAEEDPELAAKVTPIFITVDPDRDTPEVVGQFAKAFHPRFVGLTGTQEQITAAAKEFKVFYSLGQPREDGSYLVEHSGATILFDPKGEPVAILSPREGAPVVAQELAKWVH
ncbi:electron transporter SenC [Croceicoccus mobilis]|uniref:Electron transporter SenC n=2 Tax=Croceicoccus mobilis TaxID=1703339 RepID=A0A916Z734_9SPHN|nr:electron transporter SenC [Croceicoccus mobilis]